MGSTTWDKLTLGSTRGGGVRGGGGSGVRVRGRGGGGVGGGGGGVRVRGGGGVWDGHGEEEGGGYEEVEEGDGVEGEYEIEG